MSIENVFVLFFLLFLFANTLERDNFVNGGMFFVLFIIGKQCMKLFSIVLVRFEIIICG